MFVTYLALGCGVWCLYHASRGINPNAWNPGSKLEAGKPMPRSMRLIYGLGGVVLTAFALLFLLRRH